MLDGTHWFECQCGSSEHTLTFIIDKKDPELYCTLFLSRYLGFFNRLWVAFKYVVGMKAKNGHWDYWMLQRKDAENLRNLVDEYIVSYDKMEKALANESK